MSLKETMNLFWSRACVGESIKTNPANPPSCEVSNGLFIQRIMGHPANFDEIVKTASIPKHAIKQVKPGMTVYQWYTHADQLFGESGPFAQAKEGYQVRQPQLQLSYLIQRGVEMGVPVVGEAGTGTGKSFAYVATLVSMGKRVMISAPTNALIEQLINKDLPFIQEHIFPDMTYASILGKSNYFCPAKIYRETEYIQNGQLLAKTNNDQFVKWFESPGASGTIQDYPHNADESVTSLLCDEDSICRGCIFRDICPYQSARSEAVNADVIVTNHAMLSIATQHKDACLLPEPDVLVIDEAHELVNYARNSLGAAISKKSIEKLLKRAAEIASDVTKKSHIVTFDMEKLSDLADLYMNDVWSLYKGTDEQFQVMVDGEREFESGKIFAAQIHKLSLLIWDFKQRPASKEETKWMNFATSMQRKANEITVFSSKTRVGEVRYVDIKEDTYMVAPFDVSKFLNEMIEPDAETLESDTPRECCQGCKQKLVDSVFVLNGLGYCSTCINERDLFFDAEIVSVDAFLAEPPIEPRKPYSTVLVSATLATGNKTIMIGNQEIATPDFDGLRREMGITQALEICVTSPFDYKNQLILYIPKKFPSPKSINEHQERVIMEAEKLVKASRGGAFLLFTSTRMLKLCHDQLADIFRNEGFLVLKQGETGKAEILRQFKENKKAVLFATRSFWTGVDLPGCIRLEIIDKLPFEAPGPIQTAQSKSIEAQAIAAGVDPDSAKWLPFKEISVPTMVRTLKQGVGRVIRDNKSNGVCAIMDPRIWSESYGKTILDSLPPGTVTSNMAYVERYFRINADAILLDTAQSITEFKELPF